MFSRLNSWPLYTYKRSCELTLTKHCMLELPQHSWQSRSKPWEEGDNIPVLMAASDHKKSAWQCSYTTLQFGHVNVKKKEWWDDSTACCDSVVLCRSYKKSTAPLPARGSARAECLISDRLCSWSWGCRRESEIPVCNYICNAKHKTRCGWCREANLIISCYLLGLGWQKRW